MKTALRLVKRLMNSFGIELGRMSEVEKGLAVYRATKISPQKFTMAKELVTCFPNDPRCHLVYAEALSAAGDVAQFEQYQTYARVREELLDNYEFRDFDVEFINEGMGVGALGNHYAIEGLFRANQLNLRPKKPIYMLKNPTRPFTNEALFSYFKDHVNVVSDNNHLNILKPLESMLSLPLGLCLPFAKDCYHLDLASNVILQNENGRLDQKSPFTLRDEHHEQGVKALKQLGLPEGAWYVTVHVREGGYYNEKSKNRLQNWRNADIATYTEAFKKITDTGGWVFRMGDPTMAPVEEMDRVIDYAHHSIRSDWMDVFLAATCKFCIGTASGFHRLPQMFNVPVIQSNSAAGMPFYSLGINDMLLPKKMFWQDSKKSISLREMLSPPINLFWRPQLFEGHKVSWVDIARLNKTLSGGDA